jgi:hypothetical protein
MEAGCGLTRPVSHRVTESCFVPMDLASSVWEYGPLRTLSSCFDGLSRIPNRCLVVFSTGFPRQSTRVL